MTNPFIINCNTYADIQPKSEELLMERKDVKKDQQRKLRSHPLFFGITMGLLAEIINSRSFLQLHCTYPAFTIN